MRQRTLPATRKAQGKPVGTFTYTLEVGSRDLTQFRAVEALVDTGASFTRLPGSLLRELGHTPAGRESFELGDGSVVEWEVSDVPIRIGDRARISTCIWGSDEATPVLGALTLEQFLLMADPDRREIVQTKGLFYGAKR